MKQLGKCTVFILSTKIANFEKFRGGVILLHDNDSIYSAQQTQKLMHKLKWEGSGIIHVQLKFVNPLGIF